MHSKLAQRPLALLLGLSLLSATAAAQRVTPTDSLEDQAAARVAAAVCDKRVVLLGELPEHGEARGFGVKARVVERLVTSCGFRAVLIEAGSYDFFGLERAIATRANSADSLELALARAIGGLWWTRELAGWRRWLLHQAQSGRVKIGGLDDQPSATAAYAKAMLPGLAAAAAPPARAAECREAVARHLTWGYTAAQPYDSTEQERLADCARLAAARARVTGPSSARTGERTPDQVMLDNLASYFERGRSAGARGAAAPPDRDSTMALNFAWWAARLPRDARIVVWTATVHASRVPGPLGVPPLGARLAERWGDGLAVIGVTALQGQWSRGGQASQTLAPLPPQSLEARALTGRAGGDAAAWAYLDRAALRSLGAVPSRLFGKIAPNDWSTAFDGVLVIRDEGAPTFEPRR